MDEQAGRGLIQNRKGQTDIVIGIFILFIVAVSIVFGVFIWNQMTPPLTEAIAGTPASANVNASIANMSEVINGSGDFIFSATFIAMLLGCIISSFMFFAHPIFSVLFIILGGGAIVVSVFLNNIGNQMIANSSIVNATLVNMPILNKVMFGGYLPLITIVIVAICLIIIYAKSQQSPMGMGSA